MNLWGFRVRMVASALSLLIGLGGCWGPEPPLGVKSETDVDSERDASVDGVVNVEPHDSDNPWDGGNHANVPNQTVTSGTPEGDNVSVEGVSTTNDDQDDDKKPVLTRDDDTHDDTTQSDDGTQSDATQSDATQDGTASQETDAPVKTARLHVDHFMQDCSLWEGQLFCHRVSDDGEHWALDYYLFLDFFRWGYRYVLDGHYVSRMKNGALIDDFKVDRIVSEELVDPFSRFELHVNPLDNENGKIEHVVLYSAAGRVIGGAITTRPFFYCYPEVCEALAVKLDGETPFSITFEYNSSMQLYAIEIDGEVARGLPAPFVQNLRSAWEQNEPTSYVVRECTEGAEPVCTLAVVDAGAIIAVETRTGEADWASVELVGGELDPVNRQFEHLAAGEADSLIYGFRVNADYQYVSRIDYEAQDAVFSHTIDCFVPDSLDPEVCED